MAGRTPDHPVVIGITGASGSVMARAAIDRLLSMGLKVIATASPAARMVWQEEMDESFGAALERWGDGGRFTYHPPTDLGAPIASGTFPTLGMAIIPCSMATIAAIAHGLADNLVRRAADVCLKERRPLVLVPREAPLSAIHLENMARLATLGVNHSAPRACLLPTAADRRRRGRFRCAACHIGPRGSGRRRRGYAVPRTTRPPRGVALESPEATP